MCHSSVHVTTTGLSKISFFNFCLNCSRNPQPRQPEDFSQRNLRQTTTRTIILPNGGKHEEEIEHIHDYSWRNFFATINYAKIMQKLSKGRPHRIWMLVHYKSSVCLLCMDRFSGRFMHLLGCAQTGTSRNASNVTTEYPQTHQKSSALLWQEMAPM